jgi:hypothetical protein
MKKIFAFFAFFLIYHLIFSQSGGYKIKIKTKNLAGRKLEIGYYSGSTNKVTRMDTSSIKTNDFTVNWVRPKSIVSLLLQIKFKDSPEKLMIDVENSSNLEFVLNDSSIYGLKPANSNLNKKFIAYQLKSMTATENATEKIKFIDDFIKEFPNTAAQLYLKLEKKRLYARATTASDVIVQRNNFFNGIDLVDVRIKLLPNAYGFINAGFGFLPISHENYMNNVSYLLGKVGEKSKLYPFYLDWIFKNLYSKRNQGMEKTYVEVYKKYLLGKDVKFSDPNEYTSIATKARMSEKLANGLKIPEIIIEDTLTVSVKLHDIYPKSKYTLVVFFDPDCKHCQQKIIEINHFFEENPKLNGYLQKISILNAFNDSKWKSFIPKEGLASWQNFKPFGNDKTYQAKFEAFYNPTLFLIDENGIILDKGGEPHVWKKIILE